jgi:hypothetical protein
LLGREGLGTLTELLRELASLLWGDLQCFAHGLYPVADGLAAQVGKLASQLLLRLARFVGHIQHIRILVLAPRIAQRTRQLRQDLVRRTLPHKNRDLLVGNRVLAAQRDACLFANRAQGVAQGFHLEPDGDAPLQQQVL